MTIFRATRGSAFVTGIMLGCISTLADSDRFIAWAGEPVGGAVTMTAFALGMPFVWKTDWLPLAESSSLAEPYDPFLWFSMSREAWTGLHEGARMMLCWFVGVVGTSLLLRGVGSIR